MTKCDYIRYARRVQHLEINIIHHINRLKIKKSYDFINRYRKNIHRKQQNLFMKNSQKARDRREVLQHDKEYLQRTYN